MENNDYILSDNIELMSKLSDKSVFFIVDPPFGLQEHGGKKQRYKNKIDKRNGRIMKFKELHTEKNWDNEQPKQKYFDELFRVSKKIIMFGENYLSFKQKESSSGRIIWDKLTGENDFSDCEILWTNCISSVRKITYLWSGMMQGKSIPEGHISQGNKKLCEKRIHPTQKPVILYKELLTLYADPKKDIILDTNAGSGSLIIACIDLGFNYIACENDPDIYKTSLKRVEEYKKHQNLFIMNRN